MSREIDERVVSMEFDNQRFERNTKTTMNTLEKLKKSLNLTGATKGLENIDAAAKKVDMSPLSKSVENVGLKFNAMYTIADQALRNIVNSAMVAGKRIVSALTIDPIKTGFKEYETQINAVQTILANTKSKGTTIDDVNKSLDELNTYADKTIYNFTEMTRNIGTFTAAGVDLETATNAIQGIANLAAVSGSTSQQASTAMYQLSQALASGTVKLMDWNSVVNAGMGGQVFQDALKETARVHGVAIDDMIEKNGSFRETLKDGWLTSEILTETLQKFTLTTEGLTEAQIAENREMLKSKGYTDEQINAIFELGKTATDAATKVKTFTQLWDTLKEAAQSGWTQTWEIIVGDFEEAKSLLTQVSNVIGSMIGESAKARNEMLQGWKDLGGRTVLIEALKNAFEGIMSIVKPIKEAFREIFPPMTSKQLMNFTEGLRNLTEKFKISETTANNLKKTFKGVFSVFNIGIQIIKGIVSGCMKLVGAILPIGDGLLSVTGSLGDFLSGINESISKVNIFEGVFQGLANMLKSIANGINNVLSSLAFGVAKCGGILGIIQKLIGLVGKLFDKITVSSSGESIFDRLFNLINGGMFTAIGLYIIKFIKSLKNASDGVGDIVGSISNILGSVGDAIDAFTGSIKAGTLQKIAISIGILAASLFVLSTINPERLTTALIGMTVLFKMLMGSLTSFGKILDGNQFKGIGKLTVAMIGISTALLILSGALKIMSTMSWSEMGVGLISLTVGLGLLIGAVRLLPEKKLNDTTKVLKKLSTSLLILAIAIKIMSTMSWSEMGVGLISMTVGLGALVGAVHLLPKDTNKKAGSILVLASSLVVLGTALKILSSMSLQELLIGLGGMIVGLGALVGAVHLLPKDTGKKAGSVFVLASAMVVLGSALKILSSISWQEMIVGIGGMAVSLGIFIGALWALPKDAAGKAATILLLSSAMVVLGAALKILGSMSIGELAKGIISIAAMLTVLGVAAYALSPVSGVLLAIGGAVALLGIGCIAAGVGITSISVGITALATAIVSSAGIILAGANEIVGAFTTIILSIVTAMVECIPAITNGLLQLVVSVLAGLAQHTPQIVNSLFDFLIGLINALAQRLPDLIKAGVNLIMSFFKGVIDALKGVDPKILMDGLLAVGFMTALMAALASVAALTPAAMVGVLGMAAVVAELAIVLAAIGALAQIPGLEWLISEGGDFLQKIGTAIGQFLGGIIGGFAKGMTASLPQVGKDLSSFMTNALPFIAGAKMVDPSALSGVKSLIGIIVALTGANVLESITSWLTGGSSLTKFGKEISAFAPHMKKYADTVKGIDESSVKASANAAEALSELASNLPNSGGMVSWFTGDNELGKFAEQLVPFGSAIKKYAAEVAGIDPNAVTNSSTAAKSLVELANNLPNTGGMGSWFSGDNTLDGFAKQLIPFGKAMKEYSVAVAGIDPNAVTNSATAAKSLVELSNNLPNSGGMVAWFTGDNTLDRFGEQLVPFGKSMKEYSVAIAGIDAEAVAGSATAAKSLGELAKNLPNTGGMVAWFTGDNTLDGFGEQLVPFGKAMKEYGNSVAGIDPEAVTSSATAAKSLGELAKNLPNKGGMVAWFTGDNDLGEFAKNIVPLGKAMKEYGDAVTGIDANAVTSSATAAKSLSELAKNLPDVGGLSEWFTGNKTTLSEFGTQIGPFGAAMKAYSAAVTGIDAEAVTSSATAAKSLGELASVLPNTGSLMEWFNGNKTTLKEFGSQIIPFGTAMKGYGDAVAGIDANVVTASTSAAKSLGELAATLPNTGGLMEWFSGNKTTLSEFGKNLSDFGIYFARFSSYVDNVNVETTNGVITSIQKSANALQKVNNISNTVWFKKDSVSAFGKNLSDFGIYFSRFSSYVSGVNVDITNGIINSIAKSANALQKVNNISNTVWFTGGISTFGKNLSDFGIYFARFSSYVSGVDGSTVSGVINSIAKSTNALQKVSNLSDTVWFTGDISTFGKNLSDFGIYFSRFSSYVSGVDLSTLNPVIDAVNKITSLAPSIQSIDPSPITQLGEAIVNLGQTAVEGIVTALEKATSTISSKFTTIVQNTITSIKGHYTGFYDAGKYLVEGFAKGIEVNTYKAAAKAKAMAKAAEEAAKRELNVNSPSKKFIAIGGSVVEGFGKGISSNLGDVKDSAKTLGSTMLKATQSYLKINSPSIVFEKEVGRYIVQGIAEGIKKDMSAEEAAEKKAQNIVNAFKKEFDKYDTQSDIASKELSLWATKDGKKATEPEKDAKELEYLNGELSRKISKQTLAYDEWQETVKYFGESSEEAKQAWSKYLDAQLEVAGIQESISEVNNRNLTRQNNEYSTAMSVREKLHDKWLKTEGVYATDAEIDAKELGKAYADLHNINSMIDNANKKHEQAINNYAADSEEVLNAWNDVVNLEILKAEKEQEIVDILGRGTQREIDSLERLRDDRDKELSLWEEQNANLLSEADKDEVRLKYLNDNLDTLNEQLIKEQQQYNEAVAKFGKESEEAQSEWEDVYNTQIGIAQIKNDITQINKNDIEREKEALESSSDAADIEYQIWEKTVGRKATHAEKDLARVGMLSKQLSTQSKLLTISQKEWAEACDTYGKYSNEAQAAYKEYLSQQLAVANLQNEITDINEKAIAKQKLASSEYKDYIEKYEKYYAMNGMSRDELEKDARLVSGYDPNKTVNKMVNGTNTALENIKDSNAYTNLISNFTSLGTSYVEAVNEGVSEEISIVITTMTSMVDECIKSVKDKQAAWIQAGSHLVTGFIAGIRLSTPRAIKAAVKLATDALEAAKSALDIHSPSRAFAELGMYAAAGLAQGLLNNANLSENAATNIGDRAINSLRNSIKRISEIVEADIDTQPTIRPVLDLSDVESKAAGLNSLFSTSQAMHISAGMSRTNSEEVQNGSNTTSVGNTYQFTQNNYSPKALSRSEIYRQTKNQFAAMKGALT